MLEGTGGRREREVWARGCVVGQANVPKEERGERRRREANERKGEVERVWGLVR